LLEMHEIIEQRAIPAADVEHPASRRHHVGDVLQIDAYRAPAGGRRLAHDRIPEAGVPRHGFRHAMPRRSAEPVRKPRSVASNSGSSSRTASWPLSLSISTKLTLAATALRACTTARLSRVGNSQSLVKENRQKRTGVPRNTLASTPPCSAARSK